MNKKNKNIPIGTIYKLPPPGSHLKLIGIFVLNMHRLYNLIRFHRNWWWCITYKIHGKIKGGFNFKTRSGLNILVPARLLHTFKECFLDQTYLKRFTKNVIEQQGLTQIHLLKLDCEGAEYDILYPTSSHIFKKINALAIETHQGPGEKENITALNEFLNTQGYTTRILRSKIWAQR